MHPPEKPPELKFKVLGVIEVSASGRIGIAAAVFLIFFWTITSVWT